MADLMRKIQPVFDRSSARLVLTTGMANTICNRIGEPNYKVINKLNSTYLAMHEHLQDRSTIGRTLQLSGQ